ncbi:HAD-IA family hydrolase [Streptomyces atratus]
MSDHFAGRIISADDVSTGKPAPDLFLHTARSMGVDPGRRVVIEDSAYGVQAAGAAGMGPRVLRWSHTGLAAGTAGRDRVRRHARTARAAGDCHPLNICSAAPPNARRASPSRRTKATRATHQLAAARPVCAVVVVFTAR